MPVDLLFPITCATPFSNLLCAKELKNFDFLPCPPKISPLLYPCPSLQIVVLCIYLTERSSAGFPVKQLSCNKITMLPLSHLHRGPPWRILILLSLDLTDLSKEAELRSASAVVQGKKESAHPFLPLCPFLQLLAHVGHSCLPHLGYMGWTCASNISRLDCASHKPSTRSDIFLMYFLQKPSM